MASDIFIYLYTYFTYKIQTVTSFMKKIIGFAFKLPKPPHRAASVCHCYENPIKLQLYRYLEITKTPIKHH